MRATNGGKALPSSFARIALAIIVVTLGPLTATAQEKGRHSSSVGAKAAGTYTLGAALPQFKAICTAFTGNLNESREVHFDVCESRLSKKYPRFARADWTEIALQMPVAEKI